VGQELIDDLLWLLQQDTVLAEPAKLPRVELRDKDDLPILAAAIAAGAEVLVTGDKELLELGHIEGLQILSPRQFWEKLKSQKQRRAARGKPRRSS
jgi:predicted nucleic acid-binding protein